jgi:hypothetical protein
MTAAADRDETPSLMEPMLVGQTSRWRSSLNEQALELVAASTLLWVENPDAGTRHCWFVESAGLTTHRGNMKGTW